MGKGCLSFDLSIEPNPGLVSVVRRFVEHTFDRLVGDPETVFRIAMSAHELLENAAKYSVGSRALLEIAFEEDTDGSKATLRLTNDASPGHIARLRDSIENIHASQDAQQRYQDLMRTPSTHTDESGLGLARIHAEGDMTLSLNVIGSTVTLAASGRFSARPII